MSLVNIFDLADTWNDNGTIFDAIKMNVTNTASDPNSSLLRLQTGSQDMLVVSPTGNITVAGSASISGISYPSSDGTAGQLISTDGNGQLAFVDAPVTSVNGETGVVVLDTDDVDEGATNLYWKEAPSNGNQYARQDGAWTEVVIPPDAVTSVNGETGVVVLDTDDVDEGATNQYWKEAPSDTKQYARQDGAWTEVVIPEGYGTSDFATDFGAKSTDDLAEGSGNVYFTNARSIAAIQGDNSWNATNWDTAYSWGDHASAGYVTKDAIDVASVSSGATIDFDFSSNINFNVTLNQNSTFTFSNLSQVVGQTGLLVINQDGTGGRTFTLPASAKTPLGGAEIDQVTTAGSSSLLNYFVANSSAVFVNYIGNFQ